MKERPVLFTASNVRAILEDRKTQTRRVVKLPHSNPLGQWEPTTVGGGGIFDAKGQKVSHQGAIWRTRTGDVICCPYGQPGDRLWVRETWAVQRHEPCEPHERDWQELHSPTIRYLADGATRRVQGNRTTGVETYRGPVEKTRVSIHMPRWASRILLEITDVRVQRVQDMDGQASYPGESDALAEGVNRIHHGDGAYYYSTFRNEPHPKNWSDPTDAFRELWDSINQARGFGWTANPWVWVLTFKCLEHDNAN